jgi:hypothetical protein
MLRSLPRFSFPDLAEGPKPLPTWDRAFDAVEKALARLGVEDPESLRSPRPVEEALSQTALPPGTLLVLNPDERETAEQDIEETVRDERTGGSVFVSVPPLAELPGRTRSLRETAYVAPTFAYAPRAALPQGLGRLRAVPTPAGLEGYRFLFADTPGFRVALVSRALPGGGFVGLWSGNELLIDELAAALRGAARAAGHAVPDPAPAVPSLDGVANEGDVWRQAEELRAYRVVREAELREIARAAALKGVALRRERDEKKQAG